VRGAFFSFFFFLQTKAVAIFLIYRTDRTSAASKIGMAWRHVAPRRPQEDSRRILGDVATVPIRRQPTETKAHAGERACMIKSIVPDAGGGRL